MEHQFTFNTQAQLNTIINKCYSGQENLNLIVDNGGLVRKQGLITAIIHLSVDAENYILLNYEEKVYIDQIVAVNGIFREDYSEC
jgi:hypothetical protein